VPSSSLHQFRQSKIGQSIEMPSQTVKRTHDPTSPALQ
jgi:hypothetical protein